MQIDKISKVLLHCQNNCVNLVFFQTSFFLIKCAPFLFKIEKGLNIDGIKAKALEIGKFHF
jgi:hypothetical protein